MHGNRELMVYQPRLIQRFMRTGIWRPHVSETVSLLHGPSLYNTKSYVHSLGFWSAGRVTACAIIWWNQTLYASRLNRDNAIMSRKLLGHSLDFWSVWEGQISLLPSGTGQVEIPTRHSRMPLVSAHIGRTTSHWRCSRWAYGQWIVYPNR